MCGGMVDIIQSAAAEIRRGKKKRRKIEITGQKYHGLPYYIGRAVATFEANEAAASVVFRTVASVKTILLRPFLAHVNSIYAIARPSVVCNARTPY